jgi:hypothetical protein
LAGFEEKCLRRRGFHLQFGLFRALGARKRAGRRIREQSKKEILPGHRVSGVSGPVCVTTLTTTTVVNDIA